MAKKKTWNAYATYSGTKYLGTVEAATKEEAEELAEKIDTHISLCHQCAHQVDLDSDPNDIFVELDIA